MPPINPSVTQRHHYKFFARAIGLCAGLTHIRRPTQMNRMVFLQCHQQHAQYAGTTRLRLSVEMETFSRRGARFRWVAVRSPRHRIQQLSGILKVASPQQCGALEGEGKAASAVMSSAAMATRTGGGDPHSERQRAEQAWLDSAQVTINGLVTIAPRAHSYVFL